MTPEAQAIKYVKSIRNEAKRKYAIAYLAFLIGTSHLEPEDPLNLSYMAAQAVRHSLRKMLTESTIESRG